MKTNTNILNFIYCTNRTQSSNRRACSLFLLLCNVETSSFMELKHQLIVICWEILAGTGMPPYKRYKFVFQFHSCSTNALFIRISKNINLQTTFNIHTCDSEWHCHFYLDVTVSTCLMWFIYIGYFEFPMFWYFCKRMHTRTNSYRRLCRHMNIVLCFQIFKTGFHPNECRWVWGVILIIC